MARAGAVKGEWPGLEAWRSKLFDSSSSPGPFRKISAKMRKDKNMSIGVLRPWAWFVEPVRGCNLRCGFCATRLFPKGEYSFMTMETWEQSLGIIGKVTPKCRIELCNAGEPTLHPQIYELIRMARGMVPRSQLLLYTNGTTLMDGRVTYRGLFESGLNMIFVDMYSPREDHVRLAEESGYHFLEKCKKTKGSINIFSYQDNPDIHVIQLSEHPGDWSRQKKTSCGFSTFLNHLDWKAAASYGIRPVESPPARRCQQTMAYVNICWDGEYVFCCFDFMRETAGTLGNVSEGIDGFFRFWLGEYMQETRRRLYLKDRAGHEKCRRCAFAANRCDIPRWSPDLMDHYWDGDGWRPFGGQTISSLEQGMKASTGLGLVP